MVFLVCNSLRGEYRSASSLCNLCASHPGQQGVSHGQALVLQLVRGLQLGHHHLAGVQVRPLLLVLILVLVLIFTLAYGRLQKKIY